MPSTGSAGPGNPSPPGLRRDESTGFEVLAVRGVGGDLEILGSGVDHVVGQAWHGRQRRRGLQYSSMFTSSEPLGWVRRVRSSLSKICSIYNLSGPIFPRIPEEVVVVAIGSSRVRVTPNPSTRLPRQSPKSSLGPNNTVIPFPSRDPSRAHPSARPSRCGPRPRRDPHRSNAHSTHFQNPARPLLALVRRASRRHAPPYRRECLAGSKVRYYALLSCAQPPPLDRRRRRARLRRPLEPTLPPAAQPTRQRIRTSWDA